MKTLSRAVTIALLAPVSAWAQVDTSGWECEYCPFEEGYQAEMAVGVTQVSDDAARFGNGTGYDEEGTYANVDGEGRYAKDGMQMRWYAEDLGLDSRTLSIEGGKQGKFDLNLAYSELPYRLFDSTSTVFSQSGNALLLPTDWAPGPVTSAMTQLDSSLVSRNIGTDRQILEFGGRFMAAENFSLFADYRRQERDGVKATSASFYTTAAYLPRPIDDYTDEVDAGVSYASGAFNMTLAYYGSYYGNRPSSLTWDNPYTAFPGAERGQMALEPDNKYHQVSLSGGYFADAMNTTIVFSAALGEGEQNQPLLPYTINSTIASSALPVSALDGKVDTNNFALTITSRPFDKARVKFSYRSDERDNQTPVSAWSGVITDIGNTGEVENNVPYSFDRQRLSLSASYRLWETVKLFAGYDRTELDRDYQEVAEQTEDNGWGKLQWRPNAHIDIAVRGGAGKREIDRYNEDVAISLGQNPLLRKYHLAYRYRSFGELNASFSLPKAPISAGITYLYADDEYTKSLLGLKESRDTRFSADLSWAVADNASVYITGGSQMIEANQFGSEQFSWADWRANHEDAFSHIGGGFRILSIGEKIDLELDFTHSDGETDISLFPFGPGSGDILPQLESSMDSLSLDLGYTVNDKMELNFVARYEQFETRDWALDGVLVDTLPSLLTMGAMSYDYDLWAIGVGFRYRLGEDDE